MSATLEKTRKNVWDVDFPDNWEISNIGKVTTKIGSGATPKGGASVYQESGTPLFRSLNIHNEGFRDKNLAFINDEEAEQLAYASVQEGDVLFNIIGASILRSSIAPPPLVPARVNQNVAILRPNERVTPAFLHAWLISPRMHSFMYSQSHGSAQKAITKEQLQRLPIALPPLTEQEAITELLDAKTREIDKLVERLEEERELLERYRRELIAHTVTHGLNPDAPLRDSGIPWLPRIPAHWSVRSGRQVFERLQRPVPTGAETVTCFRDGVVTLRRNRRTQGFTESLQEVGYQGVEVGDLVIHEMDAFAGAIGVSDSRGKSTPVYSICRVLDSGNCAFYAYLLRHMAQAGYIQALAKGIRQRTVDFRFATLSRLSIAFPPPSEQRQIADFLDQKISGLDTAASDITRQIDLLSKYRKQVINDLVTGRVRVEETA